MSRQGRERGPGQVDTDAEFRSTLTAVWDAAWNRGDVEALDAIYAESFRRANALKTVTQTREDLKNIILSTRAAFVDLKTEIDVFLIEDGTAGILWHGSGTHTGPLMGVPPTGNELRFFGAVFLAFDAQGKVIEEVSTWNPKELLPAVGVLSFASAEVPND